MDKKTEHQRVILGFLGVSVTMMFCMAGGYWVTQLLFRMFGIPHPFAGYLFACWAGFTLFWLFASLMHTILNHFQHKKGFEGRNSKLLEAMRRIASGDFSVMVPVDDNEIHSDIARGLNEMVQNLGNMETMRQDFISNVSHEIQSPLASISGFAALLQDDSLSDEMKRHYAAIIETETKRLSSLGENLLKLSALEADDNALSLQEYRLDRQIENIALTMEPQWAAKKLSIEAELGRTMYCGDKNLLSQVWSNLLHNAIKFTPEGKSISLRLQSDAEQVQFTIADTGIGIPKEDQMHIFERFYKVDKSRERSLGGNGLGLSIVKKIVDLHGGRISVESEVGKGTTVHIILPRLHSV